MVRSGQQNYLSGSSILSRCDVTVRPNVKAPKTYEMQFHHFVG